jgi:hypothetical protein
MISRWLMAKNESEWHHPKRNKTSKRRNEACRRNQRIEEAASMKSRQ